MGTITRRFPRPSRRNTVGEVRRLWSRVTQLSAGELVALAFGTGLLLTLALSSGDSDDPADARDFDAWAALILGSSALTLAWRNRFPGSVTIASYVLTVVYYASGYQLGVINLPIMVACYTLGTTGDRRRQLGIGGGMVASMLLNVAFFTTEPIVTALDASVWLIVSILAGEIVRVRRAEIETYEARARAAEAERDAEAERRVSQERLRIARDVHDVLAHTVSVMTVQAGVAEDALDRDPSLTRRALGTIRSAGKDAMAEIRAMISVLRTGEAPNGGLAGQPSQARTAPAPGLDRVPELVDAARTTGLDIDLSMRQTPREQGQLDSLLELTAYRVVQESLTNVVRHARATRATVRIEQRPAEVIVIVTDNGSAARPPAAPTPTVELGVRLGFGLRGMKERVESVGGSLTAGPQPDGGWQVLATLPLRHSPLRATEEPPPSDPLPAGTQTEPVTSEVMGDGPADPVSTPTDPADREAPTP